MSAEFNPRALARTTDPDTSHAAAASIGESRERQHELILAALRRAGRPMGVEEIGDAVGLDVHRRVVELERAGKIVKTSEKHRNRSGRYGYRYRLANDIWSVPY